MVKCVFLIFLPPLWQVTHWWRHLRDEGWCQGSSPWRRLQPWRCLRHRWSTRNLTASSFAPSFSAFFQAWMEIGHRHVKSSHEAYLNSKRIVGLVLFCPVLLLKSFRTVLCPYITLSLVPQRLAKLKHITSFFYSHGSHQLIFNGM